MAPTDDTHPAAIAALARLVEALERRLAPLERIPDVVARLAAAGAPAPQQHEDAASTWLAGDFDPAAARQLLTDLTEWVETVYLRYGDAARNFPRECWLWHPDVVEELVWLRVAWLAAYNPGGRPAAVADWHDRYRPNVVKRITGSGGYVPNCSIENHRGTHSTTTEALPTEAIDLITEWWTTDRTAPAPETPTTSRQHTP